MQFDIGLGFMGLMLKENDQLHNLPDSSNWLDSNNSHCLFGSLVSLNKRGWILLIPSHQLLS